MARYRIFCTQDEAGQLPPEVVVEEQYPAFVIASASEEVIETVRKRWPVEKLKSPTPPPGVPDIANLAETLARPRTRGPYLVVVRFRAPVRQDWIDELKATGCESVGVLGSSTFVVRCRSKTDLTRLESLATIDRINEYVPHIQLDPNFLDGLGAQIDEEVTRQAAAKVASGEIQAQPSSNLSVPGVLVADFFTEEDMRSAKRSLRRHGIGPISEAGETRLIINLISSDDPAEAMRAIVERPGLRSLEEKKINRMYNDASRLVVADRVVTSSAADSLGLTGRGEIVAVADSGLDTGNALTLHADFSGRVRNISSFPIASSLSLYLDNPQGDDGPADIYSGHGTHACGSILGNGARSIQLGLDPIPGVAPEAELVFQAVEQTAEWNPFGIYYWLIKLGRAAPRSGAFGVPDSLGCLFQPAYDQGARIHSNSWGGGMPRAYDPQGKDLDQFVWDHKDFLVLVAAGNDGLDINPQGEGIDAGSITSPATAKNCLTVAACENNRAGQFSETYGQWWPCDFPKDPFKGDPMVDSIDDVAAFSSRGPCSTGRRKPDVMAPGTFVLSTRSSQMPSNNFGWGSFPAAKSDYMYLGGTSMATPLVAGCAVLARQYLRQTVGIGNPSAALLKATLIHSARYVRYRYAPPAARPWADNEQGWGRVDLQQVLNPHPPTAVLFFDQTQGLQTGELHQIRVEVLDHTVPLRVTLVYSDFQGEDLINNLNLLAIDPDGNFSVGNDFDGSGTPDSTNNVEGIIAENPRPGTWTMRVVASNVAVGTQDFALIVSGGGVRLA